jgi:hypothetical protein
MAFEPSIAVFDSCILYPFHLKNIIVQVAVDRLARRAGPMRSMMNGCGT